jgi:glyoxylase-like metal-dependent hydrolase (beta-lactamase superfamily II)
MRKNALLKSLVFSILILLVYSLSPCVLSQQPEAITIEQVSGDVYCLYGAGGNIGILKGKDGLLLVDASYAKTANQVLDEVSRFSALPVQYLVLTHYHGDHTGGSPIIGKNAQIVSHENCKASMLKNLKPEETPESVGVPQETYEKEMTIRMGDETVKLVHMGSGHTSGDTVVIFEKAKVIHAGDLFFHGIPPYIDVEDGSDTENWVNIIGKLGEKYPDYQVIPGHGRVAGMKEFVGFADYLRYLRKKVGEAIKAGKTREETQESIDFSTFSHIQDQEQFLTKKENVGWVYDEMTRKKK